MATPVCRVLIPEALEQAFLFVVALFDAVGLTITNPESLRVTTWTDNGEQKEIPETIAIREVTSGSIRNVQFWKNPSEDVFVSWDERIDGCMFSIFLDGVDSDLAVALIGKFTKPLLTEFRTQYQEGTALTLLFE
ncbi:hypothetical protein V4890_17400 [Ralstonia solanacearum species complex bacterium KE056]|uniref:hypothetical protein n=1 Tax=Ralstonia solanacearum species complex bacterium KE056 TaxID=3119585 RepID=UPI002FC2D58F